MRFSVKKNVNDGSERPAACTQQKSDKLVLLGFSNLVKFSFNFLFNFFPSVLNLVQRQNVSES